MTFMERAKRIPPAALLTGVLISTGLWYALLSSASSPEMSDLGPPVTESGPVGSTLDQSATETIPTDTMATDTMATDTMATDTMATDTMATDTTSTSVTMTMSWLHLVIAKAR